jgi:hypothetical protein
MQKENRIVALLLAIKTSVAKPAVAVVLEVVLCLPTLWPYTNSDGRSALLYAVECGSEREQSIALQFEQAWASFRPVLVASYFAKLTTLQHHQIFKVWKIRKRLVAP